MRRRLGLALRLGLAAACLVYAFWGVDPGGVLDSAARFAPTALAAILVLMALDYLVMAARLRYATGNAVGLASAVNATLVGLGTNNILPAKAGEAAKVMCLRRAGGMSFGQGLGMVFWERFSDLHMLLAIGMVAAALQNRLEVVLPLAGVVAAFWAVIAVVRLRPGLGKRLVAALRFPRLQRLGTDVLEQLARPGAGRFFGVLMAYGAVTWALYASQYYCLLGWGADMDLSRSQVLAVFALAAAGLAVPSSPGGVGVFEAVMVAVLGMYGVDREQALAAGLVFHTLQYAPTTIYALISLAATGMRLEAVRQRAEAEDNDTKGDSHEH